MDSVCSYTARSGQREPPILVLEVMGDFKFAGSPLFKHKSEGSRWPDTAVCLIFAILTFARTFKEVTVRITHLGLMGPGSMFADKIAQLGLAAVGNGTEPTTTLEANTTEATGTGVNTTEANSTGAVTHTDPITDLTHTDPITDSSSSSSSMSPPTSSPSPPTSEITKSPAKPSQKPVSGNYQSRPKPYRHHTYTTMAVPKYEKMREYNNEPGDEQEWFNDIFSASNLGRR